MRQRTHSLLLSIGLLLISPFTFGQDSKAIELLSYLKELEVAHEVRFSYAPDDIANQFIVTPEEELGLTETLAYLTKATPFRFSIISDRYITVVPKEQLGYCGKLINSLTGIPLAGAHIVVPREGYSTVSDGEGRFYLPEISQQVSITISYIGFDTVTIPSTVLLPSCQEILLEPLVNVLEPVVFQSLFVKGINKQKDGALLLNTDEFGLLPGQAENDVLQIAQVIPGIESVDETISNINIRGGTNDENLILWEQIKMYQSGHFFGLISAFNPDLTKSVIIYKNGTPARYGQGVSGVIDMRADNEIPESLEGGAGFNWIHANAHLNVPISKKVGFQFSGRSSLNTLVETPTYRNYSQRIFQDSEITNLSNSQQDNPVTADANFYFFDLSSKVLIDLTEKDRIRLNLLAIDNTLDFTESIEASQSSSTSELGQRSLVAGLSWNHMFSDRFSAEIMGYVSSYRLEAVNNDIFTTQRLLQENEVLETAAQLSTSFIISKTLTLDSGYQYHETGISNTQDVNLPRFRSFNKEVLQTHAVHGSISFNPNENTQLNLGLRTNYFDKFNKFAIEPRLSFYKAIGGGFSFSLLGELKSQTTTQRIDLEGDFLGIEKRRWVLVNDATIPIIRSMQGSLGLSFNSDNWFIDLEGFYKQVEGITSSNQGFQNQFQAVQTSGEYSVKGLEFILNKKIDRFSTWISYLYLHNDFTFEYLMPPTFPNNLDIRHSVNVAAAYSHNNLKAAVGLQWHTGKPYTVPIMNEEIGFIDGEPTIAFEEPNTERLPDYFRTNVSLEYSWNFSRAIIGKVNLAVLNVFNNDNTINIRYSLDEDEDGEPRVSQIVEKSLGLTPNVAFQVQF